MTKPTWQQCVMAGRFAVAVARATQQTEQTGASSRVPHAQSEAEPAFMPVRPYFEEPRR